MSQRTVLIYGRSRSGKTSLIGELAEHVKKTTGKKTLVYSIDKGGIGPIVPYIKLGVIDLISQDSTDPWLFMNHAAKGEIKGADGKWSPAHLENYGMIAHESMTGYADAFMNSLADKASQGINIGGAGNINFAINSEGETLKVGGSNQAHYGIVQTRILDEVWRSQRAPVPIVLWTASASKEDDMNASGKVIGPQVVGKALTSEIPRHFDLTFRVDCVPAQNGKAERHIIYLGNSVDVAAGNAVSLGNTRIPMHGKELPPTIEPASLVQALKLIEEAEQDAMKKIEARLKS